MTDADAARIERKLDEILFLLGKGRGRTTAELGREADAIILRLQNRKPNRKKDHERAKRNEG